MKMLRNGIETLQTIIANKKVEIVLQNFFKGRGAGGGYFMLLKLDRNLVLDRITIFRSFQQSRIENHNAD